MTGNWDLITYHHSFEHISAPLEELQKVRELLSETGKCIIRIPVVDSYAWEHYRTDWVQLDAPRHFFLYSLKSFTLLAEKAGLMVEKVEFDSTAFQFWGSEQYKKDIPLDSDRSYHVCQQTSVFTSKELREFKRRSIALNRDHAGDQVIFYLNKK
jgi:hypothetical protein